MMAIYGMFVFAFFVVVALTCGAFIIRNMYMAINKVADRVEAVNRGISMHWGDVSPTVIDYNGNTIPLNDTLPPELRSFGIANDDARNEAWQNSNREHFVMCGACGKSVQLEADLFTLKEHDCDFNPDFMKDTLRA